MQKISRAQADFFRGVGGAYEHLCRARVAHDVITSRPSLHPRCWDGHNKRSMCSSCIHIFVIVIYVYYFRLLSKTFDLWHDCQSRNTWPRLMNINFQSRFSAQWNHVCRFQSRFQSWFQSRFSAQWNCAPRCEVCNRRLRLLPSYIVIPVINTVYIHRVTVT